jgi:hypothetical protein
MNIGAESDIYVFGWEAMLAKPTLDVDLRKYTYLLGLMKITNMTTY